MRLTVARDIYVKSVRIRRGSTPLLDYALSGVTHPLRASVALELYAIERTSLDFLPDEALLSEEPQRDFTSCNSETAHAPASSERFEFSIDRATMPDSVVEV